MKGIVSNAKVALENAIARGEPPQRVAISTTSDGYKITEHGTRLIPKR